jgi:hypothetical protein
MRDYLPDLAECFLAGFAVDFPVDFTGGFAAVTGFFGASFFAMDGVDFDLDLSTLAGLGAVLAPLAALFLGAAFVAFF